ncbi:MAG: HAMP domain-containing protein, partial [Candidatus Peribacteraceae bacterium]|nr:HAMP domain-containing protein [Candidatus Peribacteraceae bacterium]
MEERKIRVIFSKIGSKLIVPYLIISFLTLAIIAGLVYYNYNVQVDSIQKIQDEISIKASSEINFYIERIVSELELFSNEIGKTNRFDKTLNLKSLKNLIEHDPSIYSLSIADINGIEINKIVKYYDMETASELKDTHTEEKFKKAIEGDIFLGPIYISKYDIPFISISSPISDDDGEIIGVLASEVDLSPMWGTISKIKVKKTGYVYVVDNDGHLIAYKDIALVKEHLDLNHIGGVRNFFNNVHVSDGYISFNDEEVIGDWKMIEIVGWGLIVELPSKEVFQELSPLLNIGGISVIAFVLFIIIIPMIILRVVLKPLGYLQEGVMEVRSGNLGYKISKTSKDEIGEITSAFNQMTVDLKKSQESIKKHAEEMEGKVEERTSELNEKLGELSDTKTAVLNMMEDMDEANIKLIKTQEELEKSLAELKETV